MAAPAKPVKQKAWRFGQFAETIAVWYLRVRGYRVLARRFRCRAGEIDIVARRRRLLVFVEVKARRHLAAALRPRQAARITRAAEAFVQAHRSLAGLDQRFDVILVVPRRWPVHLVDAWRPEF